MTAKHTLLLVGCGKMGSALLEAWQNADLLSRAIVIEPHLRQPLECETINSVDLLPEDFFPDVIIFAVKPQVLDDIAADYRRFADTGLFVSIMAGKSLDKMQDAFGKTAAIVRTMPNLPAAVGAGMTVLCANDLVSPAQKQTAESLMAAAGNTSWIKDENLLDAVTAVSGSGPAYLFHLCEALEAAGIKAGLDTEMAATLARQTVIGSAALLAASDDPAAALRENVTSPGGTTAAALEVLMKDEVFVELLSKAVLAAKQRSEALRG